MAGDHILRFSECSLKDVARVGGKGANLGELFAAGFPVPPGFGIVAGAYEEFLAANRLDAVIADMAAELDFSDPERLTEDTARIRSLIVNADIPPAMAREIAEAYRALGDHAQVAVRSSLAVPDLGVSSFPGQLDTFYNVCGVDELLGKVKLCWSSLWTARAAASRWNKGISHRSVKLSALVQQMIPSEFSGVAFTVNPVTLAPELVIEAIPGLGEDLVLGRVTPERFLLDKHSLEFREKPDAPLASLELVRAIAEMATAIEKHYGQSQDVEWAWADSRLYALQSRKIAAPTAEAADYSGLERWNKPPQADEQEIVWTRAWSDEVLTRAITPLFYSVQAHLISVTYDFIYSCYGLKDLLPLKLMRFHKNRGYFSTRYLMECMAYVPRFARGDDALKFFTPDQKQQARVLPFRLWSKLASELRLALRHRRFTFTRCHRYYYGEWLPELRRRVQQLDSLALATAAPAELEAYFWGMDRLMKEHCQPIGFGVMVHTFAAVTGLEAVLRKWCGAPELTASLLCGLPGNSTVETNHQTWLLASEIAQTPHVAAVFAGFPGREIPARLAEFDEGRDWLRRIEEFRKRYDFRGAQDREISFPRWGDDIHLLMDVLKVFVCSAEGSDPEATRRKNVARREQETRELLETLSRQRFGLLKKFLFNFLLKYAQIYSLFRENQRYEVDRVFYGQRKAFLAIGKRLVQMGLLTDLDDVWFLSKEEVFDVLHGRLSREQVQRKVVPRKAEYRRYRHDLPASFLQGDREFEATDVRAAAAAAGESALFGVPASPGTATGVARVVLDMRDIGRVQPGDILVTNSTDPGWTPVFLLIRGLVLETGGILAHGTVLSREYGIPAVTCVAGATHRIKEGQLITVDGLRGQITC
jgi:phosphohistidine swiveling domain-containing protein